ncbi:MAG: hypothetical protein IBX69_01890 [Anaerolineales bacterium]|nr:hypothetical protein [Anaerolineales bacterium]
MQLCPSVFISPPPCPPPASQGEESPLSHERNLRNGGWLGWGRNYPTSEVIDKNFEIIFS